MFHALAKSIADDGMKATSAARRWLAGLGLLAAALLAGCAPPAGPPTPNAVVSAIADTDRAFMSHVASTWLYEIEVSRLAATRAVNPRVRSFAELLAREHAQANGELGGLMRSKGVAVPAGLSADKATKLHRLSSLKPSTEFDAGYVRVLGVEDHRDAIGRFERAQREVRDRDLRRWIDKTLPRLRSHLAAAQKLAGTLSG